MTVEPLVEEWMAGCNPLPAAECRCEADIPWQDPGEAARCAKCGLRLGAERAAVLGALPEPEDSDASADPPPAEDAEGSPASALRGPGPVAPDTQDGRPRRNGQAPQATAGPPGPGSPQLLRGDAA